MQVTWHQVSRPMDTRVRLLTVAADLVHKQGFFKTSLDEIASDAEIAKATIYHHFKNKEELGRELINFNTTRYLTFLREHLFVKSVSGLNRLRNLSNFVIQEFTTGALDKGCPVCNLVSELSNFNDAFRRPLEEFFINYRQLLTEALKDARECGEINTTLESTDIAGLFLAQLQGGLLLARVAIHDGDRAAGVAVLRQTVDAFFALLLPNEESNASQKHVRNAKVN